MTATYHRCQRCGATIPEIDQCGHAKCDDCQSTTYLGERIAYKATGPMELDITAGDRFAHWFCVAFWFVAGALLVASLRLGWVFIKTLAGGAD